MPGAWCSLEVSEMVLTKCRNTDETNEVTTFGSSNDTSSASVSMELVRMESRPCSSLQLPGPERNNPHIWFNWEVG